jgi:phage terminase large subunit GpA-like protein
MFGVPNLGFSETKQHLPIGQWAEQHIVMPRGGPHEGYYFSRDTQPFTRLWFEGLENSAYNRHVAVGPTQSGKTAMCSAIPVMYHLFHLEEDVIYGVPTIEMAKDKWQRDLLPMIEASEFKELLPKHGRGSRGGKVMGIEFQSGVNLRFMGAGGGDKTRAGYTARVVVMTEVDGYDTASEISREADKVTQMEARQMAFGSRKATYMECTASIEEGRIWREYQTGSHAVIEIQCPLCHEWVTPEREHFKGWEDATSESAARKNGCFHCPTCSQPWTEEARRNANKNCRTSSKNDSSTFSFRWSAVNNLFLPQSDIAFKEWQSARNTDRENAEKEMCQFYWAIPYRPTPPDDYISVETLEESIHTPLRRGIAPDWAECITIGADVHKFIIYWVAVAWRSDTTGHIIDYGTTDCMTQDHGEERGIEIGLDTMHEFFRGGWLTPDGDTKHKTLGCVDCGYRQDVVVNWCRRTKQYFPSLGQGASNRRWGSTSRRYAPTKNSLEIGEQWHIIRVPSGNVILQHNVDYGKTAIHQKLQLPQGQPGSLTLFDVPTHKEHLKFLKHLVGEQLVLEKGELKWIQESKNNHYLDALVLAWTAARKSGVKLLQSESPPPQSQSGKGSTVRQLKDALTRLSY